MSASIVCWRCDVCGNLVDDSQKGYVTWRTDDKNQAYNFKIIHQNKCDLGDDPSPAALSDFLGHDGLTKLLSFLSLGPINIALGRDQASGVASLDEFVDFVRRVQTPFYETARSKFTQEEVLDDLSDANEIYPYLADSLRRIAAKY